MNIFQIQKANNTLGFTLIEILVACSIMAIATFAILSAAEKGVELSNQALRQTQATYLLEEGAEATTSIRDTDWSTIAGLVNGTTYYLSFDTGSEAWSLATTPVPAIDSIFTRTVVFHTVDRDSNDDISPTGTPDDGTKKVTVTVSWPSSQGVTTRSLSLYLSDIFN